MKTAFDIVTPFRGWPIPCAAYDGGNPIWITLYPFDPHFLPGVETPYDLDNVGSTGLNSYGFLGPTSGFLPTIYDHTPGLSLNTAALAAGNLDNFLRPKNIGGSARPGLPISGRQYWEVLIVALPNRAPPSLVHVWSGDQPPHTDWFSYINEFESDLGPKFGTGLRWPPTLNTFLSPTIGLWPSDPTFTKTSVIGLDNLNARTRSIGVTRTSALTSVYYTVSEDDSDTPRPMMTADSIAPLAARYPGLFPSDPIIMDGEGAVQGIIGDAFLAPDINTIDGTNGVPHANGSYCQTLPISHELPPVGVTLYGAPLIKGRGDRLLSLTATRDGGATRDGPNRGGFETGGFPNGVYTGIDLGGMKVMDRLLFATDTSLRRFWVGKNGRWFPAPGPPDGPPSCYLDGQGENYFPGCSTRLGPTTLRFCFGASDLAYPVPKAFRLYDGAFLA